MLVAVPQEIEAWMHTQSQSAFIGDMLSLIRRHGGISGKQLDIVIAQRDAALAAELLRSSKRASPAADANKVALLPEDVLAVMRTVYGAFDTLDSAKHAATVAMLDGFTVAQRRQVLDADIKHVSAMAADRL